MSETIKVSIIIPFYNVENYLPDAIQSAIDQTYPFKEIILVDNNSNDNSYEIARSFCAKYPDMVLLKESGQGASFARNHGLEIATGEWIQFLDADDLLLPDKIALQIAEIKKKPDTGFIVDGYTLLSKGKSRKFHIDSKENPFSLLVTSDYGNTISNLWKKADLQKINGWNTSAKVGLEYDLMFRLLVQGSKPLPVNTNSSIVRTRPGQLSHSDPVDYFPAVLSLKSQIFNFIGEKNMEISIKTRDRIWQHLYYLIMLFAYHNLGKAEQYKAAILPAGYKAQTSTTPKIPFYHTFLTGIAGFHNAINIVKPLKNLLSARSK